MVAMAYKEPGERLPLVLMQYSLPPGVDARQPYMLALKPKHSRGYKTESQNARNRLRNLAINPGMPPLDREDAAKALVLLLTFENSYIFLLRCGQSNCRAWYDLRPGFVTSTGASDLARLSSTMRSEYADLRLPDAALFFRVSGLCLEAGDAAVALEDYEDGAGVGPEGLTQTQDDGFQELRRPPGVTQVEFESLEKVVIRKLAETLGVRYGPRERKQTTAKKIFQTKMVTCDNSSEDVVYAEADEGDDDDDESVDSHQEGNVGGARAASRASLWQTRRDGERRWLPPAGKLIVDEDSNEVRIGTAASKAWFLKPMRKTPEKASGSMNENSVIASVPYLVKTFSGALFGRLPSVDALVERGLVASRSMPIFATSRDAVAVVSLPHSLRRVDRLTTDASCEYSYSVCIVEGKTVHGALEQSRRALAGTLRGDRYRSSTIAPPCAVLTIGNERHARDREDNDDFPRLVPDMSRRQ
jgi:hypothetical protein